jgi:hypothetical protein
MIARTGIETFAKLQKSLKAELNGYKNGFAAAQNHLSCADSSNSLGI